MQVNSPNEAWKGSASEKVGIRLFGFPSRLILCYFGIKTDLFFVTMSSEEFILFAFSYTESCRCSINVLN